MFLSFHDGKKKQKAILPPFFFSLFIINTRCVLSPVSTDKCHLDLAFFNFLGVKSQPFGESFALLLLQDAKVWCLCVDFPGHCVPFLAEGG